MPFKNPDDKRKWRREYRRRCKSKQGLTATRPQPEGCEVCGNLPLPGRRLDFDHCHATNRFRGWLCNPCNMALGGAKDDAARLRQLAQYLDDFKLLE